MQRSAAGSRATPPAAGDGGGRSSTARRRSEVLPELPGHCDERCVAVVAAIRGH